MLVISVCVGGCGLTSSQRSKKKADVTLPLVTGIHCGSKVTFDPLQLSRHCLGTSSNTPELREIRSKVGRR